jgi:hypothetical protein
MQTSVVTLPLNWASFCEFAPPHRFTGTKSG